MSQSVEVISTPDQLKKKIMVEEIEALAIVKKIISFAEEAS